MVKYETIGMKQSEMTFFFKRHSDNSSSRRIDFFQRSPVALRFIFSLSYSRQTTCVWVGTGTMWERFVSGHIALIQNTQQIKRTLFNRMKEDRTCKFSRMSSFSSYKQQQQQKQQKNKHLIQLILCQLDVGGWRKEKGTRLKSQRAVENRENWRKLIVKSSVVPQRPSRWRDWWW